MNAKAKSLSNEQHALVEPTGLSVHNVSTARDFMGRNFESFLLFSLALMLAVPLAIAGRCENGSRYHRPANPEIAW